MSVQNCHCSREYHGGLHKPENRRQRMAWRNALAALASPIVRLHQLRNARTRMLHEALGGLDRCESDDADA